jgi:hypothetical protein
MVVVGVGSCRVSVSVVVVLLVVRVVFVLLVRTGSLGSDRSGVLVLCNLLDVVVRQYCAQLILISGACCRER